MAAKDSILLRQGRHSESSDGLPSQEVGGALQGSSGRAPSWKRYEEKRRLSLRLTTAIQFTTSNNHEMRRESADESSFLLKFIFNFDNFKAIMNNQSDLHFLPLFSLQIYVDLLIMREEHNNVTTSI